jgi:hypothetical protein
MSLVVLNFKFEIFTKMVRWCNSCDIGVDGILWIAKESVYSECLQSLSEMLSNTFNSTASMYAFIKEKDLATICLKIGDNPEYLEWGESRLLSKPTGGRTHWMSIDLCFKHKKPNVGPKYCVRDLSSVVILDFWSPQQFFQLALENHECVGEPNHFAHGREDLLDVSMPSKTMEYYVDYFCFDVDKSGWPATFTHCNGHYCGKGVLLHF